MTAIADWGLPTEQFWMWGRQPEQPVEFAEHLGMWNVYGYQESTEILADPATYRSDVSSLFPQVDSDYLDGSLLQMDGVAHRKLRALVSNAFTPKTVADLEPRIHTLTTELLDAVAGRDRIELVEDLAYPLPVIVIAELLGIPAEDRTMFREWVEGSLSTSVEFSLNADEETLRAQAEEQIGMLRPLLDYLGEHAADRRRRPRQDLLTRLVTAEVDGQKLTDVQVVNFANLLLVAGHITTTMLLGNTMLCLDANPEQARRVRADRALVPGAIEESLRLFSPFAAVLRMTAADVRIGGRDIPAGQLLMVRLGAANRDPNRFTDPDAFDPARQPNRQLAFGRGVHFCLGAPLARLEGRVALNLLLDRFGELRTMPEDPPRFLPSPDLCGLRTLPLRIG